MAFIPANRAPTSPGEILLEEFIVPHELTQASVARAIGVPYQRLNEVVRGVRKLTPETALRLATYFGTTADFWLNLQLQIDLYHAMKTEAKALKRILPLQEKTN